MPAATIALCNHLKSNGIYCASPALRGQAHCYFHANWRRNYVNGKPAPFALPLLEDANAIQLAIQRVIRAILTGELDNKRAGLILFALQTASANLKNTDFEPFKLQPTALRQTREPQLEPIAEAEDEQEEEEQEEEEEEQVPDDETEELEQLETDTEEEQDQDEGEEQEQEQEQEQGEPEETPEDETDPFTRLPPASQRLLRLANGGKLPRFKPASEVSDRDLMKMILKLVTAT